jgi:hypothetical protein
MEIFYTGNDIEELAASGVTRLEIGPSVQITDVARQLATELGVELVRTTGASVHAPSSSQPASQLPVPPLPAKPRGCQHGPLQAAAPSPAASTNGRSGQDGVVNRLVNIMNQLTDRGG